MNMNTLTAKKGFTLIELLIVIAIIAILATAVILLLNPAALLAQARDSQRISDLDTMRTAISLYLSTVTFTSAPGYMGAAANCYVMPAIGSGTGCLGRNVIKTNLSTNSTAVTGAGWLPVNFGAMPGGSPLSVLPKDPVNNTTSLFYSYSTDGLNLFELNANMESVRYANAGSDDAESTDGGNNADIREVGNAPGLAL